MKYRKLRIAWSIGCGMLCLLLIVLWVRSYSKKRSSLSWRDGQLPGIVLGLLD